MKQSAMTLCSHRWISKKHVPPRAQLAQAASVMNTVYTEGEWAEKTYAFYSSLYMKLLTWSIRLDAWSPHEGIVLWRF